jgi:hypothetical protein
LPFVICLHLYKATRELGVALLVIWMAWRLIVPLIQAYGMSDRKGPVLPHVALFLGLLLVNARPIALRDDLAGASQFLLIALGLVIGTLLSDTGWKTTLAWLGCSTIPLMGLFLWHGAAAGYPFSLSAIDQIYNILLPGHGGISRFATLVMMLTLCAWYGLLLRPALPLRVVGLLAVLCGYILCLGSGSRVAHVAVPLAAGAAWLVLHLKGRSKRLQQRLLLAAIGTPIALALWWFQVGPETGDNRLSDVRRMEAARCWLSLMFSGRNRFLFGVGYGSEKPNQFCYHIPDARGQLGSIGHAHNTFAQMGGQHGILGILALLLVVLLVVLGLRRQLGAVAFRLPLGLQATTWAEASLGFNIALAFNALATTIHIGNQVNQVLIGLLAATALRASPSVWLGGAANAPSPPDPEGPPPARGGAAP